MIPSDIHFQYPWFVFFLLGVIAIIWLFWSLSRYRKKIIAEFSLSSLAKMRHKHFALWKAAALCFSWFFATIALMKPIGNAHYPLSRNSGEAATGIHEVIIVMDASDSMSVSDTRIGKSRLNQAQEIADVLISQMAGQDFSLFTFTTVAAQQVPETMDALYTRLILGQIQINEGGVPGTDFLTSFRGIAKDLSSRPKEKMLSIVIFSDGGDTKWLALSGSKKNERAENIAKVFKDLNAMVITVGVGSKKPHKIPNLEMQGQPVLSKLEPTLLKMVGQHYFDANDETTIGLAKNIAFELERMAPGMSRKGIISGAVEYDQYFQVPLFIALLFLLLAFWLPETKIRRGK